MVDDILSQEEVDALLKGVTGEEDTPEEQQSDGGVKAYDIGRQERIVRGRMPTLELINERFARQCRIGFFNLMRKAPEISISSPRIMKYSEFVRNLVVPTNLNLVHAKPLRGTALYIFDPNLVFAVVDSLFGGDGQFHMRVEGRDFTPTEQRIIHRMLEVVFDAYQKAWEPVYRVNFEYIRSEMNTQFAAIATPTEVVVTVTFKLEFGGAGGDFHVCMPYAMIEPIRDLLYSSMQADSTVVDDRWRGALKLQIENTEVDLVAPLGYSPVTLGQILDLKIGDILSLEVPEAVIAEVDGVPLFECKYGVSNGQYALKVKKVLDTTSAALLVGNDKYGGK